jgi:putative ABC transport system permease protein
MTLLKIAWRSVQHRSLSSTLTGLSMALGVALVVTVLVILNTVDDTFRRNAEGFHLILGAKGGKLDLVLNTVFHLSKSEEPVPYDFYFEFTRGAEGVDAKEVFRRLDANGDGVLSTLTEVPPLVKLLCERADRRDGWVTEHEFRTVASRPPFARAKLDIAGLWAALDPQRTGRVAVTAEITPKVRELLGPLGDPDEQVEEFLEDSDKKPYDFLTEQEVARALARKPYSFSGLTSARVMQALKADAQGRYPKPTSLPQDIAEALVKARFAYFLWLADDEPDGKIALADLEAAVSSPGRYGPFVEAAIPYCLGDSYSAAGQRFRVVGTTPQLFEIEYRQGKSYRFAQGRNMHEDFRQTGHFFEAVIGSVVARQSGLKVGDHFEPTHGVSSDDGMKHDSFEVVGILEPTGTPNDRALFVNIEGFYVLDNHAKDGKRRIKVEADGSRTVEPLPLEQREVTAILLQLKDDAEEGLIGDQTAQTIHQQVNEGQVAQAVYPTQEVLRLFEGLVGKLQIILLILGVLIVIVAGIGILVAIYNSMSERVRDIAVMRALGAGRFTVMMVVLLESSLLACLGGLCGFFLAHGLIGWVISPWIMEPQTGVSIRFTQFVEYELLLIPGLIVLSALAGFLPALAAYRTDVGKALSAAP